MADAAYYAAHREERLQASKEYYWANREKVAQKNRAYREKNRPALLQRRKVYREANKEEISKRASIKYKARATALRLKAIEYLGGKCKDCGYNATTDTLQFDHLRDKKAGVGTLHSSWGRMKEELDKCELVCANCHAIRTAARRRETLG